MREKTRWILVGIVLALALLGVGFMGGFAASSLWAADRYTFPLLAEARDLLAGYYIGELPDPIVLQRGMIRGMVEKLGDPYTTYQEPASHEIQSDSLAGEYGGIGVQLSRDESGRYFMIPFEDGPAARAGIVEGDLLLAVEDLTLTPDTPQETVVAAIRGPIGTRVKLSVAPHGDVGLARDYMLERQAFSLPSVTSYLFPDENRVGVIKISLFSDKTPDELKTAFRDVTARGAQAIVLDLRGNNGGLLDSAIEVARFFLGDGIVMTDRGRGGDERTYRVLEAGEGSDIPLVAIVDSGTASAAEIVAAALQENQRAPLIGSKTFGKGSVQTVLELRDHSSLHVTSSRWFTPSKVALDGSGLEPDIPVDPGDGSVDAALLASTEWVLEGVR